MGQDIQVPHSMVPAPSHPLPWRALGLFYSIFVLLLFTEFFLAVIPTSLAFWWLFKQSRHLLAPFSWTGSIPFSCFTDRETQSRGKGLAQSHPLTTSGRCRNWPQDPESEFYIPARLHSPEISPTKQFFFPFQMAFQPKLKEKRWKIWLIEEKL